MATLSAPAKAGAFHRFTRLSFGPLVLLTLSIIVLQIHGVAFWVKQTGNTGVLWSFLLEAAALWFWSRRTFFLMLMGVGASLLTLVGPLYEVGYQPLNEAWETHQVLELAPTKEAKLEAAYNAKLAALEAERATLSESLRVYESNSENRAGWLNAIESTAERLQVVDAQLLQLAETPSTEALPSELNVFSGLFIVGLQLVSLVMFQVLSVICILVLSREYYSMGVTSSPKLSQAPAPSPASKKQPVTSVVAPAMTAPKQRPAQVVSAPVEAGPQKEPSSGKDSDPVLALLARYEVALKKTGFTQTEFAKHFELSPKQLSFFKNHERRVAQGDKTASQPFLERLSAVLDGF